MLVAAAAIGTTILIIALTGRWSEHLAGFGDNDVFVGQAEALSRRQWNALSPEGFLGLPYVIALVSSLTSISALYVLVLLSWTAALATIWLAADLWGTTIAAWMGIISLPWLQRAALGGSEPLFMCLLLAAFVAARRDRFLLAMCAAAVATTVRPVGVFAILVLLLTLIRRRAWTTAVGGAAIAVVIAAIYSVPLWLAFGDPLANVHWYRWADWSGQALPVTWPVAPIVRGWFAARPALANSIKTIAWITIIFAGYTGLMVRRSCRDWRKRWPVESGFAVAAFAFVVSYNAPLWAWVEFARFAIPVAPFALLGLEPWLPTHRAVLWTAAVASGVLAAVSLI